MEILQFIKNNVINKTIQGVVTTTYFASCIERRVYQVGTDVIIADYVFNTVMMIVISNNNIKDILQLEYTINNEGEMDGRYVYCIKV